MGRSRVSVANTIRLLRLPEEIKNALLSAAITEGHARALLMLDEEETERFWPCTPSPGGQLSVRQTEELVRRLQAGPTNIARQRSRTPETEALEGEFREASGTKVELFRSSKGGKLVIHFYSEDDLDTLLQRIVGGGAT